MPTARPLGYMDATGTFTEVAAADLLATHLAAWSGVADSTTFLRSDGALSNTLTGGLTLGGALSGVTTLGASGLATVGSLTTSGSVTAASVASYTTQYGASATYSQYYGGNVLGVGPGDSNYKSYIGCTYNAGSAFWAFNSYYKSAAPDTFGVNGGSPIPSLLYNSPTTGELIYSIGTAGTAGANPAYAIKMRIGNTGTAIIGAFTFAGAGTHTTGNTEILTDAAGGNLKIYAPTGKTMSLYFADILGTTFSATGQTITGTAATDGPTASANLINAANWTTTGWTGAGPYTHTVGNLTALSNTLAGVVGTKYTQVVTITARTAGSVVVAFGGNITAALAATGTAYFQATTTGALTVTPTTDFDGTVAVTEQSYTAPASSVFSIKDSSNTVRMEIRTSAAASNTYIGLSCGYYSVTGTYNTGIGYQSLASNLSGSNNVATGTNSLYSSTTGNNNVASGTQSLYYNSTGGNNVATGLNSLFSNTTGSNNVATGYQSGYNSGVPLQTLSLCSFFGYSANSSVDGITNSTALGNAAQVTASNQIQLGNTAVTAVNTSGKIGNTTAANPVQFAIPTPVAVATVTATAIPGLTTTFRGCIEVQGSDGSYGRFQLPQGSTTSTLVYGSATVSGGVPASTKWGIDYSGGWRFNNQTAGALTFTLIEVLTGIA